MNGERMKKEARQTQTDIDSNIVFEEKKRDRRRKKRGRKRKERERKR